MLAWLRRRRLARRAEALTPSRDEVRGLCARTPCLAGLDTVERDRLARLAGWILADKTFHGAGGLQPEWQDCLPVALHAALPLLARDPDWYRHFRTFILYRDEFEVEIEETDEAGIVHRGRDRRAGEAWYRGPVVLSLADVAASGHGEGYDVVIHELAHQIDQLSGDADGGPPLPRGIDPGDWRRTFTAAYRRLHAALDAGIEPFMDPYAAESAAEYFAVAVEYFFDAPRELRRHEAGVYRLLAALFAQDPARRASS